MGGVVGWEWRCVRVRVSAPSRLERRRDGRWRCPGEWVASVALSELEAFDCSCPVSVASGLASVSPFD